MNVILIKDVDRLGKVGQKVTVKNGYGRNYLLPRGLAVSVTRGSLRQTESLQAQRHRTASLEKEKAQEMAQRLGGICCTMAVSVGQQGKLHGAVTASDIVQALAKQGISIEKHQLELEHPITQVGEISVSVRLHPEVKAAVKVSVVPKQG